MPIFALLIGILFVDAGIRNNAKAVFTQVGTDAQGFLAFGAAIMILAIAGTSTALRPISKALFFLVFTVFLLKNGNAAIKGLTASASATATTVSQNTPASSADSLPSGSQVITTLAPYIADLG